jgi:hypothetical protein
MPPKPTGPKPPGYLNVPQRREREARRARQREPANPAIGNEHFEYESDQSSLSSSPETSSDEDIQENNFQQEENPVPLNVLTLREEQMRRIRRERRIQEQREANIRAIRILENQRLQQAAARAIREQEQIDRDARAGVQAIQQENEARRQRLRESDERRVRRMSEALEETQAERNRRNPWCSIQ